jgi:beta-glucosidase
MNDYSEPIASLALRRKVTLLTGAGMFTLAPETSIGLDELRLSDGPTGVRGLKFNGADRKAALLPNATLLASTWSEETAYEVGRLLAEEAMAQRIHVVLGPTINLHRTPLGGRLFEAYSEDPLLTGKLAAAYVRGLQDNGVGACPKHLVANESETERNTMNSVLDEATLRELYLLPFEITVAEADPWSIMAAYNDVNGVPATEQQHINNEIVKGEWGWTGLIMSDWFATKSAGPAANGGLDLVMPGVHAVWGDDLVDAVESGEVPESVIDDHLRRLLRLADRTGALGEPRGYPEAIPASDSPQRRELLTRLAAEGMTVLTNRDATLPLIREQSVALIGRHAVDTINMGGGSAQVHPPYQVSVAEGLTALLGDRVTVVDGVEVRNKAVPAHGGILTNPSTGAPGIEVVLLAGDGSTIEERHCDNAVSVVGLDDDLPQQAVTLVLRGRVHARGPLVVGGIGLGGWRVSVGGQTFEYQLAAAGGAFGEEILAPPTRADRVDIAEEDVLEARVNVLEGDGSGVGTYGLIARPAPRDTADVIADAVRTATAADVAVVVVGLSEEQETESVDKSTLHLPGAQDELVTAVAAAAARTVVVVNAATPVIMPWLDEVDAVLWAGLPGQEGGHAVAAALLGEIEPAGRLVTTFPTEDGRTPAWSVTPVDGRLEYTEGPFIGHRGHYAGRAPEPAFWFGHGLGYTTWEYADAKVVNGPDAPTVAVTVTNTGSRNSREIVQVYLVPTEPDQPVRLVGWQPVRAAAGESVPVEVPTDGRMWRRWDTARSAWTRLADGGRLLVARGLGDVRATVDL